VCYRNGRITTCRLKDIYGKLNLVDIKTQYDVDRYNGRRTILNGGNGAKAEKAQ
jgi:hypothetical protein